MVPDNDEFVFWHAVTLAGVDKLDEALPVFVRAFRMNPSWMLLVPRLVQVKQLPATPGLVAATLGIPEARVRCIALDVGGGFGGKGHAYPEDLLLPFLARRLGRPVKVLAEGTRLTELV